MKKATAKNKILKKIKHQGIRCKLCGTEIYSMHRHDYKHCPCGNAMVDGGWDYLRYGAENDMNTIEIVEKEFEIEVEIKK